MASNMGSSRVRTGYCYLFIWQNGCSMGRAAWVSLPPATKLGQGNISEACVKNSVHRGGLQAHTRKGGGGCWGLSGRGVCPGGPHLGGQGPHPRGGVQAQARGLYPSNTEADTPSPSRRLLLRAVRILLECILVVRKMIFELISIKMSSFATIFIYLICLDYNW